MKKILITGCSSGFGFDSAKYLAVKGHHIFASMRNINGRNSEPAKQLRDFANLKGVKIDLIEMDVLLDESVNSALSQLPVMDVLINNAGLGFGGPVESFSAEECLDQLNLNIVGTLRVAKAVLPGMRAKKSGLIIQLSSVAGRCAFPAFGIYHASKWGLEGMSESMRYELAPLGIDVVLVEPGPFSTKFLDNIIIPDDEELNQAYQHVHDFYEGFKNQVKEIYEQGDSPTDPMLVVETFERLIDMPAGTRPLRNIVGLDFGAQSINDAVEPLRKTILESMDILSLDGPAEKVS